MSFAVSENRFLPIAAIHQTIDGAGKLYTGLPRHDCIYAADSITAGPIAEIHRLTPSCFFVARAGERVGEKGSGHVFGTRYHSAFKIEGESARALAELPKNVRFEVSFLDGFEKPYGFPGSVRLDAVEFDQFGMILQIFDLKTGTARLTPQRIERIQRAVRAAVPVNLLRP